MLFPRLLTQQTSEAMHVQGNDGQSNRSGKSLRTYRPNTVEAGAILVWQALSQVQYYRQTRSRNLLIYNDYVIEQVRYGTTF